MKATLVSSPRNRETGKIFHIYNVTGTPAELEDYKNSPNFKAYPRYGDNGEIQFFTNYISMKDEVVMIKKKDGNYTLDQSEENKAIARLNAIAEQSAVLADKMADRIADDLTSVSKARGVKLNVVAEEETADETTTDGLDKM